MNRVIHFEIHASDPKRAAKFYETVFGWEINEWVIPGVDMADENRYWSVSTGSSDEPGIDGGIVFRRGPNPMEGQPVNSYICTIGVDSLDQYLNKAVKAGAEVLVPKMVIKGVGYLAYCKDTEGNIFGLLQEDKTADENA